LHPRLSLLSVNNKQQVNMATHKVKKIAVDTVATTPNFDLGGLKSSRYEKLQVSYGVIAAGAYTLGDTLIFSDVPSQDIIKATVVAHGSDPAVLDVYPGSDNSGTYTLSLPSTVTTAVKLSYIIEYIRGGGRVGPDAYKANAYGSGQALESGEGDLFKVIIATGSATAAVAEEQVAGDSVV
jgi:hypothetical protein